MPPFLFPRYRMTEEGDALRIHIAFDSYIVHLICYGYLTIMAFVASSFALYALRDGLLAVGGAIIHARPFPWNGLLFSAAGLAVGWVSGHGMVACVIGLPRYILHGRDAIVLDRRRGRVFSGKAEIGPLEQVVAVRHGLLDDEDGELFHVAELQFAGDSPQPFSLWSFAKADEAETFARAVADFVGVPAVARKKPGPAPDLAALADDALVS